MTAPVILPGASGGVLLICDHASNMVPDGIDLGIGAALFDKHIAIDIGAAPLTEALAARLGAPAILATVSRLVIDLHRQPDHASLIPETSDGHIDPGQCRSRSGGSCRAFPRALSPGGGGAGQGRAADTARLDPQLYARTGKRGRAPRPWHAGILYNRDRRAADLAVAMLRAAGIETGDNEPYSGRMLNATLNRHGEANGIPSLAIEIRNDLIRDAAGVNRWRDILTPILTKISNSLAQKASLAT